MTFVISQTWTQFDIVFFFVQYTAETRNVFIENVHMRISSTWTFPIVCKCDDEKKIPIKIKIIWKQEILLLNPN